MIVADGSLVKLVVLPVHASVVPIDVYYMLNGHLTNVTQNIKSDIEHATHRPLLVEVLFLYICENIL